MREATKTLPKTASPHQVCCDSTWYDAGAFGDWICNRDTSAGVTRINYKLGVAMLSSVSHFKQYVLSRHGNEHNPVPHKTAMHLVCYIRHDCIMLTVFISLSVMHQVHQQNCLPSRLCSRIHWLSAYKVLFSAEGTAGEVKWLTAV